MEATTRSVAGAAEATAPSVAGAAEAVAGRAEATAQATVQAFAAVLPEPASLAQLSDALRWVLDRGAVAVPAALTFVTPSAAAEQAVAAAAAFFRPE
ncbi:hypothetical protein [Phytohabitans suffuscus]|uniref:hypothetical protein n=1 Tax=Phytohabitans suffuscus TaxID=624315 RepID=UPI0015642EF4|nr:hypothetical protein [Phytohabitans suffuscus]